jgi:hypothetical protein
VHRRTDGPARPLELRRGEHLQVVGVVDPRADVVRDLARPDRDVGLLLEEDDLGGGVAAFGLGGGGRAGGECRR